MIIFSNIWKTHQILNILKRRMIVLATFFRKLHTLKDLDRPLSKKHRFGPSLDSQLVKESQTYIKSE